MNPEEGVTMAFPSRWPLLDDRFFAPFFQGFSSPASAGVFPAVNIFDDGEKYLVRAEMPGVDRGSLDVTAQGDQLIVRGERSIHPAEGNASYHRRECEGGKFRRAITLPQNVDAENIKATFKNGVLEVELPRAPELKPRKISVN
jgi:HSP20 family protein